MTRWAYIAAFSVAGLVVGTAAAFSLYTASLVPGARASGYAGVEILGLVPAGMFLGTVATTLLGLSVASRAERHRRVDPAGGDETTGTRRPGLAAGDWLDIVLGALTSVTGLPALIWAMAVAAGPVLGGDFHAGPRQGYLIAGDLGLGLALAAGLILFRRLRRGWPAFAYALAAAACLIAPVLWGVVQIEAALSPA